MSRQYFGTDGIRGLVGKPPMTPEFALKLGWAAGRVLADEPGAHVLIGKDTRRSGYLFESALEAGLSSAGVRVSLLGPLPTPAVAFLTREAGAHAGIVISASHNPHHDNGVKFFSSEGDKLGDDTEAAIERWLAADLQCVEPERLGLVQRFDDGRRRYVDYCCDSYQGPSLSGLRVVLDCANGAAYQVAPAVLRRLGADVAVIADHPDGFNINLNCGSTHLDALRETVLREQADLGIALDGDADRCLLIDHAGQVVDGDQILYLIAKSRMQAGALKGPVIGTLMTNLGVEQALGRAGIGFERAKVGDRYVLELMRARGSILGGEGSGHTICLDRSTTGDGIIAALEVLSAIRTWGVRLAEAAAPIVLCPQVLINVRVAGKASDLLNSAVVREATNTAEAALGRSGRVLLRASGTEPVVRVMVEAQDGALAQQQAELIAQRVRESAAHS
jgi:phosphoglucosamine mutase